MGAIIRPMPALSVRRLSVFLLMVLFVYYEVYRWMPLGPWNGEFIQPVHNRWLYVDIVIGLLLLWMTRSFYKRRIVNMWVSVTLLTLWLGMHLKVWWIPYAKGTGPETADLYKSYSSHTQILPLIGNHHPPDGGQTVLDFLIVATWFVCLLASIRTKRKITWFIA